MSSCNRDGTAHKACSIFYLVLWKKEKLADSCSKKTESHRAQGWKDNASQAGKKSKGVTWEEGSTEGLLRGRGRGGSVGKRSRCGPWGSRMKGNRCLLLF